ncbi:MAG: transcriptional regulator [Gammaproteobacteria bacterium CG11_big_fil_rev_8_21_14_0_20_46_22]|nr:MAG: transcriptional regulator [Gammaproteobacteria bacterium CG12_big_fil_rev_8_21_14_0_65_46_12]PIR11197.1 MAG: transcriptional regulator [Gammaproteobacteria bacterium CG11_big_fil_rev_8_21_14_0_20_46_22]
MSRKGKTSYALLGVLSFGPKSAYEISQFIERSTRHFWSESDGQLYPNLKKLTEAGLLRCDRDGQSAQPNKKLYSLTKLGEASLLEWLRQAPTTFTVRNEFLLQLFFGHKLSVTENIQKIEAYRHELVKYEALFDSIEQRIKEQGQEPSYLLLSLSYGQYSLKAEIQWCDHAIKQLKKGKK